MVRTVPGWNSSAPAALLAVGAAALAALAACASPAPKPGGSDADLRRAHPGLPNLLRVADGIYCGGEPDGPAGFDALRALGVRTLVSVDGVRPDAESGRARAIRTVHVPVGYGPVSRKALAALERVARELPPPVYVHCHHGRHRAPACAAILWRAAAGASADEALEVLERAGTGREYQGLWEAVGTWTPQAAGARPAEAPDLPEAAEVASYAQAMAELDRAWDRVHRVREAGWATPAAHPDLVAAHEALLLWEGFREARRHAPDLELGGDFLFRLDRALEEARALRDAVRRASHEEAERRFAALREACVGCHDRYRH